MTLSARVATQVDLLGNELESVEVLRRARRWCKQQLGRSVPLVVAGLAFLSALGLALFKGYGAPLLCNIAGTVFPAVESLKLIDRKRARRSPHAATQWLSYWTIFGSFTVFESIVGLSGGAAGAAPYYCFKIGILLFCFLPPSHMGAKFLYDQSVLIATAFAAAEEATATAAPDDAVAADVVTAATAAADTEGTSRR